MTLYSYALEVQGFPWLYDDGRCLAWGDWDRIGDRVPLSGSLAQTDFRFSLLSDPQNPLETGGGETFRLKDDGTDLVFNTFSVAFQGRRFWGNLSVDLDSDSSSTTLSVTPGLGSQSAPLVDSYLFINSETFKVTGTGPITVSRAQFDTMRDSHKVFDEIRPRVTQSPTTFRNRVVTLWRCEVDTVTREMLSTEAVPIWAGVIKSTDIRDDLVHVECDPLSAILKDNWPTMMPSATLYRGEPLVHLRGGSEDHSISLGYQNAFARMYLFDRSTGDFVPRGEKFVPLEQYRKWVEDTVIYGFMNPWAWSSHVQDATFPNRFKLALVATDDGRLSLTATNQPHPTNPNLTHPLIFRLPRRGMLSRYRDIRVRAGADGDVVSTFRPNQSFLHPSMSRVPITLDRPIYPLTAEWYYPPGKEDPVPKGYAVISNGSDHEVIGFTGVEISESDPQAAFLTGVERGLGSTEASLWGADENDDGVNVPNDGTVTIVQLLAVVGDPEDSITVPSPLVPLFVLCSTTDREQNSQYDQLVGYRRGLRLPKRWIDIDSFERAKEQRTPNIEAWWVLERDKGKDELSELMKMSGIYLTTKRFLDADGVEQFGLVCATIDLAKQTQYTSVLGDGNVMSGARFNTSHNERLVINNTKVKPHLSWGAKEAKADEIFVWQEQSIAEYGPAKALEFKPSVVLGFYLRGQNGNTYEEREATVAWMVDVSTRWFATYARGRFTVETDFVAPEGYEVQIGDSVLMSFTGARAPTGNAGITGAGKVIAADYNHGGRSQVRLKLEMSFENFCELAPSFVGRVTDTHTFQIDPTEPLDSFASTGQPPLPFPGQRERGHNFRHDLLWFDPEAHGGPIPVAMWQRKDRSTYTVVHVTAMDFNSGGPQLTTVEDIEALLDLNVDIVGTFPIFTDSDMTPLQKLYAFMGPLTGSPPKQWS